MADGGARFSTTYSIQSLLPKQGKVYTAKSVVVIIHNNVCCVIATIDDTCEGKPFQIFIINGVAKGRKYKFDTCKCVIPTSGQPTDFVLPNIVVDTAEYHEKQFIVTGKHIHDYVPCKAPTPAPVKEVKAKRDDKEGCAKTKEK
jgi:hypothetical protein